MSKWVCMICVATKGLRGNELGNWPDIGDTEGQARHLESEHGVLVRPRARPGDGRPDIPHIAAPFTPDQVLALDQYQRGEGKHVMHPFTCPNRGDGTHRENSVDLGALVPTVRGWICPYCDYGQDWAHDFMAVSL